MRFQLAVFLVVGLLTLVAVVLSSPQLQRLVELLWLKLELLLGG